MTRLTLFTNSGVFHYPSCIINYSEGYAALFNSMYSFRGAFFPEKDIFRLANFFP